MPVPFPAFPCKDDVGTGAPPTPTSRLRRTAFTLGCATPVKDRTAPCNAILLGAADKGNEVTAEEKSGIGRQMEQTFNDPRVSRTPVLGPYRHTCLWADSSYPL